MDHNIGSLANVIMHEIIYDTMDKTMCDDDRLFMNSQEYIISQE